MHPILRSVGFGLAVACLATHALHAQPGRNDLSFNAASGLGTGTAPIGSFVNVLVRQPDGHLILAGEFTEYNGQPANHIVRVSADGARDASFNTGIAADHPVFAVVLQPDGKVGSSRVDLQACKLEYSIVSPK